MSRILIVEDDPLIAMMLEDWLADMGHETVGPANSLDAAMKILDRENFDVAVLDVNLRGLRSDAVDDALIARGIPFAFATGGSSETVEPRFSGIAAVAKPYDFDTIRSLTEMLTSEPNGDRRIAC